MESLKSPKKVERKSLPGKNKPKSNSKVQKPTKSHKLIAKHKPSNSHGNVLCPEKTLSVIKERNPRPSLKPTTERTSKEPVKKLIVHRKSSSMSENFDSLLQSQIKSMLKLRKSIEGKETNSAIVSFASRSLKGMIPGNLSKVNQDALICAKNFSVNSSLFAVADGHGLNGELVSHYIRDNYPRILLSSSILTLDPAKAMRDSVHLLNKEICAQDFDTNFSGSTLISIYVREKKLYCANVGDSRALLAREVEEKGSQATSKVTRVTNNHWMSIALSRDHKPNEADESRRILEAGGRIEAYQDEEGNPLGPSRVWLQDENVPGLAMSRSIADQVAASVGVTCDPEILEFELTEQDKFVVIGSDGVFEFLTNQDIVKIVVPFWKTRNSDAAANAIVNEAKNAWIKVMSI